MANSFAAPRVMFLAQVCRPDTRANSQGFADLQNPDINLGRAGMDGWDVARLAREHDPRCGILYVSGDSAHRWSAKGVPHSLMLPSHSRPPSWSKPYRTSSIDQAGSWRS